MANKEFAFLEYGFIFEPNDTWGHIRDFEIDLGKYFNEKGYEAVVLNPVSGYEGKKFLLIRGMPKIDKMSEPIKKVKEIDPKDLLKAPKKGTSFGIDKSKWTGFQR